MEELRRTRTGPFTEDKDLVTLYDLQDAYASLQEKADETALRRYVLPVETAFGSVPKVIVRDSAVDAICHGAKLAVPGICRLDSGIRPDDWVGYFTLKGEVIGMGSAVMSTEQVLELDHGIAFNTVRVMMPVDTYPRVWQRRAAERQAG
jgi:H/ACA ribonucleoprotein complex subunit 4